MIYSITRTQADHDFHHQLRTIGRYILCFHHQDSITHKQSGMYAFARQGLQLPDSDRVPVRDEVVAIDSCLQLMVGGVRPGGAAMMEQWLDSSDGLKTVLQALKKRGILLPLPGSFTYDNLATSHFFPRTAHFLASTGSLGHLFLHHITQLT